MLERSFLQLVTSVEVCLVAFSAPRKYLTEDSGLQVLHKVGAERAAAAVLTLDTPGANYRTVFALTKNFPHVKTFVRAHDVEHGLNLEKAGATAVSC